MRGVVTSCAAPDDDPLAQCLGVYQDEEDGAVYYGEMGEGQMHGLGRMDAAGATYVGFRERGSYHGPGLLLDHEERTRQEGTFKDGLLAEGSSTSAAVDRQGRRAADGVGLEGPGVKVARDVLPQQPQEQQGREAGAAPGRRRVRTLRGVFVNDQLEGRGSAWTLLGDDTAAAADGEGQAPLVGVRTGARAEGGQRLELEYRLEALFNGGHPVFGRAFFADGRIYLGGLNRREQRVGVGLTMTRAKKAFIAHRRVQADGGVVVEAGAVILDFDAGTFRRTAGGAGGSPDGGGVGQQGQQQQGQQGQEEEAAPVRVGEGMVLPALWDAGAVTALLSAALADPGRHWGVLATLMQALLREARSLMEEQPPCVPIPPYSREATAVACSTDIYVGGRNAQGRRHGEGAGVLGNGDIYKGQWRQGRPQGKGAFVSVAHRDVFEGEVAAAAAAGDDDDDADDYASALAWGPGRWSLLTGWRVEAGKWLRPRVPLDFVVVLSPSLSSSSGYCNGGARSKVEAMYRVGKDGASSKREDSDVRITRGGRGGGGYRGSVWPWEKEKDGGGGEPLLSVPRPRMGLEWREDGEGGTVMQEAEFDEQGQVTVTRMSVVRRADGTREYGGEVMAIMSNAPKEYHVCHVKQACQRAEKEWPPKLYGPFRASCSPDHHHHAAAVPVAAAVPATEPPSAGPAGEGKQQQQPQGKGTGAAAGGKRVMVTSLPSIVTALEVANARITEEQQAASSRAHAKAAAALPSMFPPPAQPASTAAAAPAAAPQPRFVQDEEDEEEDSDPIHHHPLLRPPMVLPPMRIPEPSSSAPAETPPRPRLYGDEDEEEEEEEAFQVVGRKGKPSTQQAQQPQPPKPKLPVQSVWGRAPAGGPGQRGAIPALVRLPPQPQPQPQQQQQQQQKQKPKPQPPAAQPGGRSPAAASAPAPAPPQPHQQGGFKKGSGPPGTPAMELLCLVEAGWQAAHVRMLLRSSAPAGAGEVSVTVYRVQVTKADRPQHHRRDARSVESPRPEFSVLGLVNGVKYSFIPSAKVCYKNHSWRVYGAVVRTSPPGPVKARPSDPAQPFLRHLNGNGELVPDDRESYWTWTRYVSGHEIAAELPPMKSYALKARVHAGDGALALELGLARELQHHVQSLTVWAQPASAASAFSRDDSSRVTVPCSHHQYQHHQNGIETESLCAAVTGLSNSAPHKLAFRLQLRGGAGGYPKGDGGSKDGAIVLLFGTPQAGTAFPPAVEQAAAMAALAALEAEQAQGHEAAPRPRTASGDWALRVKQGTASNAAAAAVPGLLPPPSTDSEQWPALPGAAAAAAEPKQPQQQQAPKPRVGKAEDASPLRPSHLLPHLIPSTTGPAPSSPSVAPVGGGRAPFVLPTLVEEDGPGGEEETAEEGQGAGVFGHESPLLAGLGGNEWALLSFDTLLQMDAPSPWQQQEEEEEGEHVLLFKRQAAEDPEVDILQHGRNAAATAALPLENTSSTSAPFSGAFLTGAAFTLQDASGTAEAAAFWGGAVVSSSTNSGEASAAAFSPPRPVSFLGQSLGVASSFNKEQGGVGSGEGTPVTASSSSSSSSSFSATASPEMHGLSDPTRALLGAAVPSSPSTPRTANTHAEAKTTSSGGTTRGGGSNGVGTLRVPTAAWEYKRPGTPASPQPPQAQQAAATSSPPSAASSPRLTSKGARAPTGSTLGGSRTTSLSPGRLASHQQQCGAPFVAAAAAPVPHLLVRGPALPPRHPLHAAHHHGMVFSGGHHPGTVRMGSPPPPPAPAFVAAAPAPHGMHPPPQVVYVPGGYHAHAHAHPAHVHHHAAHAHVHQPGYGPPPPPPPQGPYHHGGYHPYHYGHR